jgi:dienelactone hydrolase
MADERLCLSAAVVLAAVLSGTWSGAARGSSPVAFGAGDGRVRLVGHLYRPDARGPVPGVVLLPDCAGITPTPHRWAATLAGWGYAALLVDSFGPRKETEACSRPASTTVSPQHGLMPDAYAAKRYLATQPWIDPQAIGLIGWGYGGWALLYAVDEVYLTELATPPFSAAIAIYPGCHARVQKLNAPLLILIGDRDDWHSASWCRDMLERSHLGESSAPHAATLKVYPGAHARFDWPDPPAPYLAYTVGRHPVAAAQAEADVKAFLARHLARPPVPAR